MKSKIANVLVYLKNVIVSFNGNPKISELANINILDENFK